MRFYFLSFLFFFFLFTGKAQQTNTVISGTGTTPTYRLNWQQPINIPGTNEGDKPIQLLHFSTAQYNMQDGTLPRHYQDVPINGDESTISVSFVNATYEPLTATEITLLGPNQLPAEIKIDAAIYTVKKQKKGGISFIPLRKNATTGKPEKLIDFDIQVSPVFSNVSKNESPLTPPKTNSVLEAGKWYKIAVSNDGVYKISYSFLKQLGVDVDNLKPKNIRLYGNGGGMLPKLNSAPRADDLLENAIVVVGDSDNVFNKEDYILFYGQGPHRWKYVPNGIPAFQHINNLFSDSTYYFITVDLGTGKRIQTQPSSTQPPTHFVNSFDDYAFHENDSKNLVNSGNNWFGEYFENISSYDFPFDFPSIDFSKATVKVAMGARSTEEESSYSMSCQSGFDTLAIDQVTSEYTYMNLGEKAFQFVPNSSTLTVNVTKKTASALAWLDFIEVNVRRKLIMSGNQMFFRDANSKGIGHIAQFTLQANIPVTIWDVTDPENVYVQRTANNQFAITADSLREFLAFTSQSFFTPKICGVVANQNLHGIPNKEMIIVTHPDFMEEAKQLAAIHEREDHLSTTVVTPQQIYNEFSSGAQDITAIRDFMRMFYNRSNGGAPKYLLLIGDGSYNNKAGSVNNTNFIPTYESDNSTSITGSFVSDDYYGLLDDSEGTFDPSSSKEAVDIGIGRFPVQTKSQAQAILNKINSYIKTGLPPNTINNGCINNQNSPFGDWRNTVCFVADDEDDNLHIKDAGELSKLMDNSFKTYNQDKIYIDAYKQESSPGGERYPDANDAIDKRVEKGCLLLNYTGHGGEAGLAHERIVDIAMINKWNNINNMPLFFTATCEFSRYDDPNRTSAGEYVFLNPKGGAIALFTTVRLVYAHPNFNLNESFLKHAFTPVQNEMPRLGDIFQQMKSEYINLNVNSRNFSLLGDPALRLTYPSYDVITDSINNSPVSTNNADTLKALSLITISGHIENKGTPITDYNGLVYPTVFDKKQLVTTLSNNPPDTTASGVPFGSPPYIFPVQKNVLYKGKASVVNGRFKYEFIVPKDISFQYGNGRISYYNENGSIDGKGVYDNIIIGGINENAANDNTGPQVNLYMNDAKFISGGTTNENPSLYAVVTDETGINTTGNGIGHDIMAILDANTNHSIVLNDYYQADLNSYKSGTIRYPFKNLAEGKHTLSIKVWDVYNNSSLATTEFEVSSVSGIALNHVLNYPNPFTTKTQFFFEHNQCCQLLNVQLQIFTVSGKLVKNFSKYIQAEGYRNDPIEWDGRDDFGDKVGRGVYVYRLKVKNNRGETAEKFEKLVILN